MAPLPALPLVIPTPTLSPHFARPLDGRQVFLVAALLVASVIGCMDQGPAARFGQYSAELYVPPPPPSLPTATPDGEFVASLTRNGARVGTVGGRMAYWPAGAAGPTYLFRPDTNPGSLLPTSMNDQGEVVLRKPDLPSSNYAVFYVWKAGTTKLIYDGCAVFGLINNRGIIWFNACGQLYNRYYKILSPFGADTTQVKRFTDNDCATGGRTSYLINFNDSNEVLASHEVSPAQAGVMQTGWFAGGCRNLTKLFDAQWQALSDIGLVGGRYTPAGAASTMAVLTDGDNVVVIDEVLDPESRAKWHITSVDFIRSDRSMVVHALDLATNQSVRLQLTPTP